MDIYVGNLPYSMDEQTLSNAFAEHGAVERVKIIEDRETGRSKGFAFVTMSDFKDAQNAIKAMNNVEMEGRPIKVNQARPREDRAPAGGNRSFKNSY